LQIGRHGAEVNRCGGGFQTFVIPEMPFFRHNRTMRPPSWVAKLWAWGTTDPEEGNPMTRIQSVRAMAMIAGTVVLLGCEQTKEKDAANTNTDTQQQTSATEYGATPEALPAESPAPEYKVFRDQSSAVSDLEGEATANSAAPPP
jgi:hypothetical protein